MQKSRVRIFLPRPFTFNRVVILMAGKRCKLFDDIGFLKPTIYPRKAVGTIYLTSNRKGGIIFSDDRELLVELWISYDSI